MPRDRPLIAAPGDWAASAECARVGADMSLHDGQDERSASSRARKAVCDRCTVLDACREWALTVPDPAIAHVAGGLHPFERAQLRNEGRTS